MRNHPGCYTSGGTQQLAYIVPVTFYSNYVTTLRFNCDFCAGTWPCPYENYARVRGHGRARYNRRLLMEIEFINPQDLRPYANNAHTHSNNQLRKIARSIEKFGFCNPVLIG